MGVPQGLKIDVNLSGTIVCTNGVKVTINATHVTLHQPGPNGGAGQLIAIPIAEWGPINQGVTGIRDALGAIDGEVKKVTDAAAVVPPATRAAAAPGAVAQAAAGAKP